LRIDWNEIIPKEELNYIIGNPPFVGARLIDNSKKEDIINIFKDVKGAGNLDYVSCWYKKASNYIENTNIEVAFVSTNSITQGEQTSILWKNILEKGININFAYRTFRWDSEASLKAQVHCIIIGFSYINRKDKFIFDNDKFIKIDVINAYLINAPIIFIYSRSKPLFNIPEIGIGNKPIDNGPNIPL